MSDIVSRIQKTMLTIQGIKLKLENLTVIYNDLYMEMANQEKVLSDLLREQYRVEEDQADRGPENPYN